MDDSEQLSARDEELDRQMIHLLDLIDRYSGAEAALGLEFQLNRVIGQWRATFVWRNRLLDRPLAAGLDRSVAAACQLRMVALADQVEDFARRWSSSALIATAFPRFRDTALILVATMEARLEGDRRLLGKRPVERTARQMVA